MTITFERGEQPRVLTVSQLNRRAKTLLESHFDFVWVSGEISNLATPASGHWYFSLKDGDAQVRCAMFRNRNQRLRFKPEQGDEVRVRCRVSLYEGRGEFQLIVEHLEPAGAGALQVAFEKLKARLLAEGLFDPARKKPLPDEVGALGVITSPTGAAIHDILTVLRRRCPAIRVYLLPVAVQGKDAAGQIADAIARANHWHRAGSVHLDALIVGRGGGSLEDLWAFNEEAVARAIAASDIPTVSAVGHEVDFSIADLAADHRAATPSAAAEMLSPDMREWRELLLARTRSMARSMATRLAQAGLNLQNLQHRLKHPGAQLREQTQRVDDLEQRLIMAQRNLLQRRRSSLRLAEHQLRTATPLQQVHNLQGDIARHHERLEGAMRARLHDGRNRLAQFEQLLDSLSPLGILRRGYTILTDARGSVVSDASAVAEGDELRARLAQGTLALTVKQRE